jgi:NarL family two-component system response regulator LiaR
LPDDRDFMAGAKAIRVLLVDSRPLVLHGLASLVDGRRPAMQVVGQATTYATAVELAGRLAPRVAVLSFFKDPLGTLDAVSALVARRARVLLLTGRDDGAPVQRALQLGASGIVFAEDPVAAIAQAIAEVSQARRPRVRVWLDGLARLAAGADAATGRHLEHADLQARLTTRELELIRAILDDPPAKYIVIGAKLGISEHTVHNHLSSIYQKLHLVNRTDLLVYAATHRIGTNDDARPYSI